MTYALEALPPSRTASPGAALPQAAAPSTPIDDLDPARVLVALLNTPAIAGEAPWPPLNFREAQALLGPQQRLHLHAYRGHPLQLYIDRHRVCGARYDAYGFELNSAAIVANLRHTDAAPATIPRRAAPMRPDAAPFVPQCAPPQQRIPSPMAGPLEPPARPTLPQAGAEVVVPPRPVLEERLRRIDGTPWFHQTLVPQLLTGAGKQMTPIRFLSFYYLSLSVACDEGGRRQARSLLRPFNNPLIPALVPDEEVRRRLLDHMATEEATSHSRSPSPIARPILQPT